MKRADETQTQYAIRLIQEDAAARAVSVRPSIEENLRAAAADWMETEIGHVYGQTVIDILEGR